MKHIKKIVFLLLIIIFLIIIVLLINPKDNVKNKNEKFNNITANEVAVDDIENYQDMIKVESTKAKLVNNRDEFYTVENILNLYLNNAYVMEKIYVLNKSNNMKIYWIEAINKSNGILNNLIVITDISNSSFLIYDNERIKKDKYTLDNLEDISINYIEPKDGNTFSNKTISDEIYAKNLMKNYLMKAVYNSELAYECLYQEYKEKKFGSLENYKEMVMKNRDIFLTADLSSLKKPDDFQTFEEYSNYLEFTRLLKLDKYTVKKYEDYTEYRILDTEGNYYIFQETLPMQYKVLLDVYTVDLPEFIREYNNAGIKEKIKMNFKKFLNSIEVGDYEYAYSKLEKEFKEQEFDSIDDFSIYVEDIFKYFDEISYNKFDDTDDEYTYEIEIKKGESITNKKIRMYLLDGTDYKLSFSEKIEPIPTNNN